MNLLIMNGIEINVCSKAFRGLIFERNKKTEIRIDIFNSETKTIYMIVFLLNLHCKTVLLKYEDNPYKEKQKGIHTRPVCIKHVKIICFGIFRTKNNVRINRGSE